MNEITESLCSYFDVEISNHIEIEQDKIIVFLADGTKSQITIKNVC